MNPRILTCGWRSPLAPALAIFIGLLAPRAAHAQDDAAETAAARALAVDGVKLAQADQCADAIDKLDRAEKLKHSPIVLRYLGECQIKVGHWVEGSESLHKLLREPLPDGATPAVEQAYESAAATLHDVKPRIPAMKIVVNAPHDATLALKVDGKDVASSVLGVALPANPGDHTIEVTAPGYLKASSQVKLAPSGNATVSFDLKRDPSAPLPTTAPVPATATLAAAPTAAPTPAPPEDLAPAPHGSRTARAFAYVSYAVAAVGLGVGIGFGQSAMHDEKSLSGVCPNKVCPPSQKDALDYAQTKGTVSTIGFAVAGGGLALGTVLLITSADPSPKKNASALPPRTAKFRPRAAIGLGKITLGADF
jgi:hypothetical protein